MVFNIRFFRLICGLSIVLLLTACSSGGGSKSTEKAADQGDIYNALLNDEVQYRDEAERPSSDLDKELVQQHINQIRSLYFRKNLSEAQVIAERLLRLDANIPEAYYWLARINMDQADYQNAYNMATKGISVTDNPNLKRELERVQRQAQMGNY